MRYPPAATPHWTWKTNRLKSKPSELRFSSYWAIIMIQYYQLKRTWEIPNLCHFCCKTETYMRMTGIEYQLHATIPPRAPKGKLPFIIDGEHKMGDSRFIIRYFKRTYGDPLDSSLTPSEMAVGHALQRLIEEHLYWVTMYTRWSWSEENWITNKTAIFGAMPFIVRQVAATYFRHGIRKQIWGHGTGRHHPEEIFELGYEDIDAIANLLGDKPYLLGDQPTSFDATGYGFLVNTLGCPIESPVKQHALSKPNLVQYVERMQTRYYSDL
jgi:glutathione S-transferase